MASYKKIKEIGEYLRNTGKEEISVLELLNLLKEETGSHTDKTINHYVDMLREAGFIIYDSWETIDYRIGDVKILRG